MKETSITVRKGINRNRDLQPAMKQTSEDSDGNIRQETNLAGPCGFYCGTCRHYLARAKGMLKEKKLKHGCKGCRIQDKRCSWVKRNCTLLKKKQVEFCFECKNFPCDDLKKLHERHVQDDDVSLLDNLHRIKEIGVTQWLKEQEDKWRCALCGGVICVMDRECYDCGCKTDE